MTEQDQRLFLLDAFALIYRAYYSFIRNPIRNSKGLNTSAVYGFTNTLYDLITNEKPTHLAVVFDAPGRTDRASEYDFYKANREAMPEDIQMAIPIIKEILKAFHIPMLELEGYEADDIIGTIAKEKEKTGHTIFMVTPDKDFAQLVSENIFMYKPSRQGKGVQILGVPEIKEQWQVEDPEQVIDILGLWGDAVDNIPGIPGIGEKIAKKLIAEYGSVENLIANTDKLKGKQKENVENFAEQGIISKQLATIIIDTPIKVSDDDLLLSEPDKKKLAELFAELEFRTLGKRILGDEYSVNRKVSDVGQIDMFVPGNVESNVPEITKGKSIESVEHNYILLKTEEQIQQLIAEFKKQKSFAFDTETTGLNPLTAEIVGISFSVKEHEAYYYPISENKEDAIRQLSKFAPIFANEEIEKIGQNIKYDIHVLNQYKIEVTGKIYDTMLAHYIMEPDLRHNMDYLSETFLGYTPVSIETLIGKKGAKQKSMRTVPVEEIKDYAAEDADITFQLAQKFKPKTQGNYIEKLLNEMELPLIPVLTNMEREGINLDTDFLQEYSEQLHEEMIEKRDSIFSQAGTEFNLNSPKQLGEVLFEKMEIPYKGKKTKTGQYITNESKLLTLANDNAIVSDILSYREITKLKSTYVDALPQMVNPNTGRIHTSFNQTIAATGRLSSDKPNLQNIPIRTERGRKIRKAFVPRNNDYMLMAADYSQVELRLVASMSEDETMINAFENKEDIHTLTASKVFSVKQEEVTREMRSHAKTVNFGIIYGVSAFGLSQQTNLSRTESKEIIENYFKTYPGIKAYMDSNVEFARKHKYVETIMGRRRYLRDIDSRNATLRSHAERNAINAPVQGSAADLIKLAMINIHDEMQQRNMQSKMLLQVHDELVFDMLNAEKEALKTLVINKMENAISGLKVPIVAEVGFGVNWLEAH